MRAGQGWRLVAGCLLAFGMNGQSRIDLANQGRNPDFSGFPMTKPARVVTALPASCQSGEAVVLGTGTGGLYVCSAAGAWVAAAAHGHAVTDLSGVSGLHGSGSQLQAFSGTAVQNGDCAEYDAAGNLRGSGRPCSVAVPNAATAFATQTLVEIAHNQGTANVLVKCYDLAKLEIVPDQVLVVDLNTVRVSFGVAQSGSCVLNTINGGGGGGGGAVDSVFGRVRNVVAQSGDYRFDQITGTVSVPQGGTGQTSWTAGRCVQVSTDGSRLESALVGCAAGEQTVVSNSGSGAAVLKMGTNVTAKTLVAAGYTTITEGTDTITIGSSAYSPPNTVVTGPGLAGDGTSGNPVRLDTLNGLAAQVAYTASLTYGTIGAQSCLERSMAANGVAAGDTVEAGWPGTLPAGVVGMMYGATNLVVVRLCNVTGAGVTVTNGLNYTGRVIRGY